MKLTITFLLCLTAITLTSAQSISPIGPGKVVELECAQSPSTATMVSASMIRDLNGTHVQLSRSSDMGATWQIIDSILPVDGNIEIPDPVITCDDDGVFSVVVMRVNWDPVPEKVTVDLNLYRSEDDGINWTYISSPHSDDFIADYPQVISDANGDLYLVYSHLSAFPLVANSDLIFLKSTDKGVSWSEPFELEADGFSCIGPDIGFMQNEGILVTSGNRDSFSNTVYAFMSNDFGTNWEEPIIFTNPVTENFHITKPVCHQAFDYFGILSHRPHMDQSPIVWHLWDGTEPHSQVIDQGAYAQGLITDDGAIHVIYNAIENDNQLLKYITSVDGGSTFSDATILHSGPFVSSESGEYQSLFEGPDGLFYIAFCDWADSSRAKMLVFDPTLSPTSEALNASVHAFPNPTTGHLTVELDPDSRVETITVFSTSGRVVEQRTVDHRSGQLLFDLSDHPDGFM